MWLFGARGDENFDPGDDEADDVQIRCIMLENLTLIHPTHYRPFCTAFTSSSILPFCKPFTTPQTVTVLLQVPDAIWEDQIGPTDGNAAI